ncbi:MAG: hypothetical protein E6I56_07630 [Chloroflexi bacterium]|nr:MAG: hypothetical protein E6I56_07630 [Chloroflexota bacterium]
MPSKKGSAARQLRRPWDARSVTEAARSRPRTRATFHLPTELLEEVRNAVVALAGAPDQLTMSKFAEIALRRELGRLREERPGEGRGKPFLRRQGEVRRGRPIG